MKKTSKLTLFLPVLLFLMMATFSGCTPQKVQSRTSEKSRAIDKVIAKTAKNLHHRHNITGAAFGMAAMKEVECLKLHFQVDRILPKDEIRAMLIDCVNEMVKNVHECEGIQPYLLPEGFSEKNVDIVLYLKDGKKKIFYPDFGMGAFYVGQLQFKTKIPEQEYGYHTDERETYQEAVAILEAQGRLPQIVEKPL